MVLTVKVLLAAMASVVALAFPAVAWSSGDDGPPAPSSTATANPNPEDGIYELGGETAQGGTATPGAGESTDNASPVAAPQSLPPGTWIQSAACDTVANSGCVQEFACPDGSAPVVWTYVLEGGGQLGSYSQCPEDPPPSADTTPTGPVDIPGAVRRAFERVDLPESTINVQPPGGETLVNLPTILSTSAERHQIPVRLNAVNIGITLEVWPSRFVWHHGDDTSQETTTPGTPWTEGADTADLITHTYTKTSDGLDLSVDTTWSAQFKVAGQPNWRPVDGTVTITGTPLTVAVLEAKPQLVR